MNFNFELILFYLVLLSGGITLFDRLFLAKKRHMHQTSVKPSVIIDYARSFFPVLLVVFLFRSFLYEPFRIPTGSLKPTLLDGDLILVNKFDYGIRLPVLHQKMMDMHQPQRGDIFVFRWPPNPSVLFIKRVIGVPGDRIRYINKVLTINGQEVPQTFDKMATDTDALGDVFNVEQKTENLIGVKHSIFQIPERTAVDFQDIVVPPGMYFAMGDNRDNSADSRFFGFVPEVNIVGKAILTWMSWDSATHTVRWNRIGKWVK
jgi:signal peptidase I